MNDLTTIYTCTTTDGNTYSVAVDAPKGPKAVFYGMREVNRQRQSEGLAPVAHVDIVSQEAK